MFRDKGKFCLESPFQYSKKKFLWLVTPKVVLLSYKLQLFCVVPNEWQFFLPRLTLPVVNAKTNSMTAWRRLVSQFTTVEKAHQHRQLALMIGRRTGRGLKIHQQGKYRRNRRDTVSQGIKPRTSFSNQVKPKGLLRDREPTGHFHPIYINIVVFAISVYSVFHIPNWN